MNLNLFAKLIVVSVLFVSLSGCTRNITNFAKGIAGQYCQETVMVYDADTDSLVETCTDDL